MPTIRDFVPDVDTLLALAPEELGLMLLHLVPERTQNGNFLPDDLTSQIVSGLGAASRNQEVEKAAGEAWAWLAINLLTIPAPNLSGNNSWRMLSRRAQAIKTDADFDTLLVAAAFPKSLLHDRIRNQVWMALARGDLQTAVFIAFKEVEIAVREAGQYTAMDIGIALMRKAFDPDSGRLRDPAQPRAEQEALSHLFAGAIGSYKNPHSHRTITITDPGDAQEMVLLASHLLGIVDSRRPKEATLTDERSDGSDTLRGE